MQREILLMQLHRLQYNLILFIEQGCPFFLTGGKSERGSCATKEKENDIFSLMNPNSTIVYGGRFPRYLNGYDFKTDYGSIEDDIKPNPFLIEDISKSIEYISKTLMTPARTKQNPSNKKVG